MKLFACAISGNLTGNLYDARNQIGLSKFAIVGFSMLMLGLSMLANAEPLRVVYSIDQLSQRATLTFEHDSQVIDITDPLYSRIIIDLPYGTYNFTALTNPDRSKRIIVSRETCQ